MKQTPYLLSLLLMMSLTATVVAQPSNDDCTGAISLGTLPAPAACGASTGTKSGTAVNNTGLTNVGATPENPYPYNPSCPVNTASFPDDVWYSFVASSYQVVIKITAATFTNPIITLWEGNCTSLGSLGCVTGAAGAATLTVVGLIPGTTYYIQVSGLDGTQTGTFNMKLTSQTDCDNCLVASQATATPPPTNGYYAPGTTVTFCDSIYSWNETSNNWLHGAIPSFGSGWNLASLVAGTPPVDCNTDILGAGSGYWAWYPNGDTSSATGNIYGPGFYYENNHPTGVQDNDPGNNYGDYDPANTCTWVFCVTITTNNACVPGSNLDMSWQTTGDGESGGWTSVACANDPIDTLYAVGACCPPTMTSTAATCAGPTSGTATATPIGTVSPWTFQWSNGTTQTGLTGASTITGLSAGIDTVTVTDALGCTSSATVNVSGPAGVNGGPNETVTCASLPGGTATMAATGAGTWTAQAGNPGTATITTPASPTTTITTFSAAGVYTFLWTVAGCSVPVTVTVTAKPNAGPNKTVNCATLPGGTATMAGTGTGTWTAQAGNPGTATITTPASLTTTITTFSAAGVYTFIWTNGTCTDNATVTVTAEPNAGPDQNVLCATLPGGTATMAATGTGTWTAQAGNPGTATITTANSPTTTITTFSAAGTYNFIWTNGTCTDVASVTVTAEPNAGPDQSVLCATLPGGTATMAATGTGTWTAQAGNPGTATITTPTSPTTTITTFSAAGVYTFIWTNGTCTDNATVTVTAEPNAGPDQNVLCATLPGGTATMAATGTGTWTAQAGNPGTATITTPASPTTTITNFSAAGTYNFIWTNGTCTDVASVTVTAEPDAGPDQSVLCATLPGGTATMAATGTGTWTAQAGNPGTATITTPTSPTTTITTFSAAGTYNFIWTNGTCTDVASVTVTAEPNAGPDQNVFCATLPGGTATMAATGTGTWTAQAGNPGTATITTPTSPTTTITAFSAAGTYNFIWTNGTCTDVASVTVTAKPNAGPDQNVLCATLPGGTATMAATGTGTWTAQAGNPGTATITSPASPTTTITTFSAAGTYNFIWTNGTCTDVASVTVTAEPNAGPDQSVLCATLPGGTATMAATGTGTWTAQVGNPGTATITSPTSPTTTITTFSAAGTYNFIWTNGTCTDVASVTVTAEPNAGPDQSVLCATLPGGTATMAATGTGTWTAQAGNPGTATITAVNSPTTTITAFSVAGTYNFIWTNGTCTDVASVTVTAEPNAGPDQSVLCATLPGGTATMAATGTGTWTAQAGNPGTATISTPASPTTTITTFSAAGTYNFIWTNGTCTDVASVTVTAEPNAGPDQSVLCATLPGGTATMAATGTGTWTAQAGNPGTATITMANSPTTTITNFSAAGTYNFIWTNGTCTDVASVTVTAEPNAGPDQNVLCATLPGGTATMAATGTGTWTAQAGNPGTATITTPTSPTTTITTFSAAGTYNFIWTNGICTDVASVTVTAEPNAGPDQSVLCATLPGGTATMAATGTGTWTAQAGNPGTATITTPTSPTTTITTFSAAGTYNFIWTNGTCTDVASVTVTAEPNAGPDQSVLCATLPGGTATMAATGAGTWTAQAGNPGTATITTANSPTTTITAFSVAGTYNFIWTNGTCTDVASVTVTAEPNAGPDQSVLCATLPGGTATMAATGTGTWTAQAGNPGTATISTPASPTTTITTFSAAGTYNFIWTNGTCTDVASVTVTAEPNAGPDQSVLCATLPGGTATMAATGTGTWTAQAGNPGTATITSPASPTTTITTFSAAGTYNFIWTNGTCTDVASVTVTAEPNAGPNQSVLCATLPGGTATMAATGTGTWTAQAGNPGTATITTPASPTTTITTFSAAGTYNFIWTNGTCTDVASVTVTAEPNAGPDQSVLCATLPGGTATMAATGTGTWTAQAGNPGTATITTPASPTTTITTFSAAGTYNIIWTNGTCTDVASVTVTAEPNAGPDQSVLCATLPGGTATMAATGTGTWTAQAGNPGTATISTPASPTTTITTFSAAGTYNFIWTNGTCTDVASVTVTAEPNAGPDQNVLCATLPGGTATMAATGTGTWTAQAGNPGTATITTPTSPTTTITTFSAAGTYNFIWTNGICTDVASVTVTAEPNAGPDQSVLCATLPGGTATMAATGTGTWTAQAGNPGTATITTPTSPTTTITTFSAAGTYNFIWTNGTCTDVASVTVTAEPNAGPDQSVLCATLPGGTATMAATGAGTWTAQAGNPGTATITTANSPTTTITAFSVAGTYNFIWTNGTCTDVASVTVTAEPNAGPDQSVLCATLPGGTATMAATGTGTWTAQAGNPGTATISTPASPTTTITTFSAAGTYNFIWTNGTCTDVASVTVTAEPNAGPDQSVLCATLPGGTATMAATGTGTWTAQAGNPGTATITSPASPTTTITTFSAAGTYNFIWTNGTCTDVASVTVTAEPNAGPNQSVLCATLPGGTATMAATGTGTWTAQAGNPGTATITTPASPTTTITTFSAAGTYNFIWTNGTCTDVASVTVTAEPNAGPDQSVLCATLPGGTATMAATGTGTWTAQAGNPGTATITTANSPTTTITAFSVAGTYNFIWTNGTCTDVASVTVTAEPNAGPDQSVLCATLPGGTATMAATGTGTWTAQAGNPGTATISTPASPTTTITTFSAAGTYNFIWTNGTCTDVASVTVTAEPDAGPDQNICINTTATMAGAGIGTWTAMAGNPAVVNFTNASSNTTSVSGFTTAGVYTLQWTVGACSNTMTVTVHPLPTPTVNDSTVCSGVTATLTATGGVSYVWSTTATTPSINTTTAGTYFVTATDINGCSASASGTVTVNNLPTPTVNDSTVCSGVTATLTATGGVSYVWSTTATTPSVNTTTAGTYFVTATDINGCSATASGTVTVNNLPTPSVNDSTVCSGVTATLTATGGVSYVWSTTATTPSINTTTAGTYFVTATDINGCSATANGTVTVNNLPTPTVNDSTVCSGATATLTATGGVSYVWSTTATTPSINTTTAGTYLVTATDINGCSATASGTVTVNNLPTPSVNDSTVCSGVTATLTATGGVSYVWSTTATTPSINTTTAGTYFVTATDINGCSATASGTVTVNNLPTPSVNSPTICPGATATLTATGGVSYVWSTTATTPSISTTTAGTYFVTVTDINGCSASADGIVTQLAAITFGASIVDSVTCFGGNNGSAQVIPQNGVGIYSYLWSDPQGQTTNPATNLAAGSYTVTVTDGSGCTATASVTISQPSQLSVGMGETNPTCAGYNNGTASATATGGIPPYSYLWNHGDTLPNLSGLVSGPYTVTVTDGNGCTASGATALSQPASVNESLTAVRTNCPNSADGSIADTVSGGVMPYTFTLESAGTILQSGNTTGIFSPLGYGLYTVVVQDQNGCQVSDTISVPRAPFDIYTATADTTSCYGVQYNDGIVHVQGYTIPNGPFLYSIDGGPFQYIPDFFNLSAGPHKVTAQDNYGCDTTFTVIVGEPLPATVQILPGDSTITPGASIQLSTVFSPYSVDSIKGYTWSPSDGLSCMDCPAPVASPYGDQTVYTVIITYNNGCTTTAAVQINTNGQPPVYIPNAFTPNGDGTNDVWFVFGTGIKDFRARIFNRWGEKIFESDNQSDGWDGTYKGQLQPPGVYVYLVNLVYLSDQQETKQGSVTLIR